MIYVIDLYRIKRDLTDRKTDGTYKQRGFTPT